MFLMSLLEYINDDDDDGDDDTGKDYIITAVEYWYYDILYTKSLFNRQSEFSKH